MSSGVYSIYFNSEILSIGQDYEPAPTCPLVCNIVRHYIALYNLCSHGIYWSVRLIKRNKNLREMVQKVGLKTKK